MGEGAVRASRDGTIRLLTVLGAMLSPERNVLHNADDATLAYCLTRARGELQRFSSPGKRTAARRARRLRRCVARAFHQRGLFWPTRSAQ